MKKTITLVLVMVLGIITTQAQTIKGFTIGEVVTTQQFLELNQHEDGSYYKMGSLAGITGRISVTILNDNRIFAIQFVPTEDGLSVLRMTDDEVEVFAEAVEKALSIKLVKSYDNEYSEDDYKFNRWSNNYKHLVRINVEGNSYKSPPASMDFMIVDYNLFAIWKEEEKARKAKEAASAADDF